MHDNLVFEFTRGVISRTTGPLKFRFVLQPLTAVLLGTRSGLQDAREGKPPFFWEYCFDPSLRKVLMRECWKAIEKLFVLAAILDCIYQVIVLHWLYPLDALVVACCLAVVPYVAVRGPVNRIVTRARRLSATPAAVGQTETPSPESKAG